MSLEKYIYNLVKKNSYVKNILVVSYQFLFCFFGLLKGKHKTKNDFFEIENAFFGFHDRPSMNENGKILSHSSLSKFKKGMGACEILITDIHSGITSVVTKTSCCNYQQGSLLTWFNNKSFIFNNSDEEGPVTIIKNIYSDTVKKLPFHFFSLSPDSKFVSSINFYRFNKGLKGYGYDIEYPDYFILDGQYNLSKSTISDFFIYDINAEKEVYRLSILEAKKLSSGLIEEGYYYFSHSCFSPSSQKIYFLLRSSNHLYNTSQLFVYDLQNKGLKSLCSGGMVSHLSWLSDDCILAFCNTSIDQSDGYYIFNLNNDSVKKTNIDGLVKDGHPHAASSDVFYTDTYPNRERRQNLYRISLSKKKIDTVFSIYSPLKFRGVNRVDFHPRLSLCKNYITIDSSHNNNRTQTVIKL